MLAFGRYSAVASWPMGPASSRQLSLSKYLPSRASVPHRGSFSTVTIPVLLDCLSGACRESSEFVAVGNVVAMENGLRVKVQDDAVQVFRPGTALAVTFRRNSGSGILEAQKFLGKPWASGEEIEFVAAAWRLAYAEAKAQGWLRPMQVRCV